MRVRIVSKQPHSQTLPPSLLTFSDRKRSMGTAARFQEYGVLDPVGWQPRGEETNTYSPSLASLPPASVPLDSSVRRIVQQVEDNVPQ